MRRRFEPEHTFEKIAVLRANGIGDYVFSVPALEALRARFPQAEIVLLGKAWHAAFLTERLGPVDRVVVIPPCPGVGEEPGTSVDEAGLERFFADMAHERFDLAIQLHGGGRYSNPFVRRLGARLTVGLKAHDAEPLDRWVPYTYFQCEIMRYLEVVSLVGALPVRLEPHIEVTEADLGEVGRFGSQAGWPLAVLHPGATDTRRHWPPEKFAAVGDALAAAGARVAVLGTAPERPIVEAVIANMRAEAEVLCDSLSLGGLAGLLSRAALMVSNDSGPLHLAAAVGTPTVGIFWCGNLINGGPLTRARHRPFLSWRLDCPRCGANTIEAPCEHRDSFVADVPVEGVTNAALDLLVSCWRQADN